MLGSDGWIHSEETDGTEAKKPWKNSTPAVAVTLEAAGVSPKLKVLYVPDYMSLHRRLYFSSTLYRELSVALPNDDVSIGLADGPFEDSHGTSCHFDSKASTDKTYQKQVLATKVDFHASIVKLAWHAAMHHPTFIVGK